MYVLGFRDYNWVSLVIRTYIAVDANVGPILLSATSATSTVHFVRSFQFVSFEAGQLDRVTSRILTVVSLVSTKTLTYEAGIVYDGLAQKFHSNAIEERPFLDTVLRTAELRTNKRQL
mmetsp:Transcript_8283/g.17895  ORF Transcript_8283/g.17895 Transcript_8283/m.17895 type:complete len:118 (-) Transcript_8283:1198-1551(-)